MRNYTINNDFTLKNGEIHEHEGVKYQRNYIGGAAFDNKVAVWEGSEEQKMWKLYKTNKAKYFKKYGER